MSIEQVDVVDAFVEIVRKDTGFPMPRMVQVLEAFAPKLGLDTGELAHIIGERDRELYGDGGVQYSEGAQPEEEERPEVFLGREEEE